MSKFVAVIVFCVSMMAICTELLFVLMLGLKVWAHMVYMVIAFALLGYGIGSNIYLILKDRIDKADPVLVVTGALCYLATATIISFQMIPRVPLSMPSLTTEWLFQLTMIHIIVALPFVGYGFLLAFLFTCDVQRSSRLYFWDLVGAGCGSLVFFWLVLWLGPLHSSVVLVLLAVALATISIDWVKHKKRRFITAWILLIMLLCVGSWFTEPDYTIDDGIGWECIPCWFTGDQYTHVTGSWDPLGRTDLFQVTGKRAIETMFDVAFGTFEINLSPVPEFSYFTKNLRAGTPVYKLSPEGLDEKGSEVKLFSQAMEFPYLLLNEPRVLVIGTGGGRDIFMARTHGASEVVGAEVNPATYRAMSRGGVAYQYSGEIYDLPGVRIENIDGRHLVKTQAPSDFDLIILNGADTFAALSTGAYAYAENYLYTNEAILDYLRLLKEDGLINFNRWLYPNSPRESLRLFVMILDALRSLGVKRPWEHVILGRHGGWGLMLVKRSPFTTTEQAKILEYFDDHDTIPVFAPFGYEHPKQVSPEFDQFAQAFREGYEESFINAYWADISVVRDDSPFFYKYYRFRLLPRIHASHPAHGEPAFLVQVAIVIECLFFILAFIYLPLRLFKRRALTLLPNRALVPFIVYFSCLGAGFILVEITLMQRFTLLLGSPIYAITVTLTSLLVFSGVGSFLLPTLRKMTTSARHLVLGISFCVTIYLLFAMLYGTEILNGAVVLSFYERVAVCVALVSPIGICLGMYFPSGLRLVGLRDPSRVPWAWAINSGFTVLGSTITIMIAQFFGFNVVLLAAAMLYLVACIAFWILEGTLARG